jgi:uncharacterized membrane protein
VRRLAQGDAQERDRLAFQRVLLVMVIALGAVLRFSLLSQESLWLDEAHSLWVASKGSLAEVFATLRRDANPPLYFVLLHGWTRLVPPTEAGARLFSAIFGTISIALVYAFGRALRIRRDACLVGALLFALSPHAIWYSQEVRTYAFLSALGLLHLTAGALLLRSPSERSRQVPLWLWLGTGALLPWTHSFGLFFLPVDVAGALVGLARLRRKDPRRRLAVRILVSSLGFFAIAVAPLTIQVLYQLRSGRGYSWLGAVYSVSLRTPWEILCDLGVGPQIVTGPGPLRIATVIAWIALLSFGATACRRSRSGHVASGVFRLFPLGAALLLILQPTLVSIWKVIILRGDRYLAIASGPLALAAGVSIAVAFRRGWVARSAAVLAVTLIAASDVSYLSMYFRGREKRMWREAVAVMTQGARPDDRYFFEPDPEQLVIEWYAARKVPRMPAATDPIPVECDRVWAFSLSETPTQGELRLLSQGWHLEQNVAVQQTWEETLVRVSLLTRGPLRLR